MAEIKKIRKDELREKESEKVLKRTKIEDILSESELEKIKENRKGEFRIRTRRFFLTYPQLPADFENLEEAAVLNYERIFKMERSKFKHTICKELHEDGNPHLHVYLEFTSVQRIYSKTKLDLKLEGHEEAFHGNYQAVKSQHATLQYILKSAEDLDSVVTNWEMPIHNGVYYTSCEEHLHSILMDKGILEARNVLHTMYPKDSIRRGAIIESNLQTLAAYKVQNKLKSYIKHYGLEDFEGLSDQIWNWFNDPSIGALVLYGPSGTGKTELAKALLNSLKIRYIVVSDKNALNQFDVSIHGAILFDDLNFNDINREELISLTDTNNGGDVRILYKTVSIPGFIHRVFTTNKPYQLFQNEAAIERRSIPVEILKPVWKLAEGESRKAIPDSSYRTYKFGIDMKDHPAIPKDIVLSFPTSSSTGETSDQVIASKPTKSTTSSFEQTPLLLTTRKGKKPKGRPKKIFNVETSMVIRIKIE